MKWYIVFLYLIFNIKGYSMEAEAEKQKNINEQIKEYLPSLERFNEHYIENIKYEERYLDKIFLTVSAGAITIIFGFVANAPKNEFTYKFLMIWILIFFLCVIINVIISKFMAIKANNYGITYYNEANSACRSYLSDKDINNYALGVNKAKKQSQKMVQFNVLTRYGTFLSALYLGIALSIAVVFISVNLNNGPKKDDDMSKKKMVKPTIGHTKGSTAPVGSLPPMPSTPKPINKPPQDKQTK
jgi:hypothetical protein